MEIFENKTKLNLENAIKVGTKVPKDAASLAWFENREVNPANNLVSLDLSSNIPENSISFDSKTTLVYSDELGIIRKMNGDSVIPSRDVTISNLKLTQETVTERINPEEVNPLDYVHYFYVSRYFIAGPIGIAFTDLDSFRSEEQINFLNIKVIDSSGNEYIDTNTQRKKYRILLESQQASGASKSELGYKIIVLLDSSKPINLKLVYDKIELDEKGSLFNQFLSYEEPINAVTLFKEVPEESEVIDPQYRQLKNFSIKKYRQKLQNITPGGFVQNGYQVFTPKKAVTDNRTYEAYNWRLIAKSNNPVDLELLPYSTELEEGGKALVRVVKVGVLYSSELGESYSTAHPYIFARLEQSPFNFSKFIFSNPLAEESISKLEANYWMVDIDTVEDLTDFDILAWSPTGKVLNYQAAKINHFINSSGTLVMDLSYPASDASGINYNLLVNRSLTNSVEIQTNFLNKIINQETSGGWIIVNDIFETTDFGIHGYNKIIRPSTNIDKQYATFDEGISDEAKIVSTGSNANSLKPIAIHVRTSSEDGSVNQSNIVATTFSLFSYCNNIYSLSNPDLKISDNNAETTPSNFLGNIINPVVEGPFKFLYNIVCYGLYSKIYSSKVKDYRSSLYNYIARWESSWVMDENSLLPEEKNQYFLPSIVDETNEERLVRSILDSEIDILRYYQQEIYNEIPEYLRYRFTYRENSGSLFLGNVDFFIESTNPDVEFSNAEKVDPEEVNIPASYTLFKIRDPKQTVYAYTNVESPKLEPYPGMGPFVVVNKNIQSSSSREILNAIDPINYFATYPYDLSSMYYYFQSEEKAFNFTFTTVVQGTATVSGIESYTTSECRVERKEKIAAEASAINTPSIARPPSSPGEGTPISCRNISSRSLEFARNSSVRSSFLNNHGLFPYTGDINNNLSTTWQNGNSGAYVAYIQYTINLIRELNTGSGTPIAVDGIYGSQTEAAIRAIQTSFNAITIDGKVDSETKFILASRGWRQAQRSNPVLAKAKYDAVLDVGPGSPIKTGGSASYTQDRITMQAWIRNAAHLSDLNQGVLDPDFKMITYSGNLGQNLQRARNTVTDIVTFEIPQTIGAKVFRVGIETGIFSNFRIIRYGYSRNPIANRDIASNDIIKVSQTISPSTTVNAFSTKLSSANSSSGVPAPVSTGPEVANLTIELPTSLNASDCRYFFIEIEPGPSSIGTNARSYGIRSIKASARVQQPPCPNTGPLFWSKADIGDFIVGQPYNDFVRACGAPTITYRLVDNTVLPAGITLNESTGQISGTPTQAGPFNFTIRARNDAQGSIKRIEFSGEVGTLETEVDIIACNIVPRTRDRDVEVKFTVTNRYTNLTPANPRTKIYDTNSIKGEQYVTLTISFKTGGHLTQFDNGGQIVTVATPELSFQDIPVPAGVNFSTTSFLAAGGNLNINFSSIKSLLINSVAITDITPDRPIDLEGLDFSDYIESSINGNSILFTTSGAYYSDSEYQDFEQPLDDQYFMINESGYIFKNVRKRVSVPEGVLRFCKEDGSPVGIVSSSDIRTIESFVDQNKEVNYKYGYFFIRNNEAEDNGVVYGFYDNREKSFIGKTISYFGLIKRGLDNVYIAIKALDADGNSETVEDFLGPVPNKKFTPTNLPLKMLAPIFSLKYNNNSVIRVNNIRSKLNKFTTWPLVISNGSFNKKIIIENRKWNDWKSNYIGQELLATYSTLDIPSNTWSTLYGHGKIDVRSEEPILISDRKIQTRLYPILNVRHPSGIPGENFSISSTGIIKPEINIYTKPQIDDPWERVPYSAISKIDSYNGIIEFNRSVVPSDESLIKVDYVVDSKDSYLYQIENELTPFNPLFMGDNYNYNEPIYVYIVPTNIYIPEISLYQVRSLKETGLYQENSILKITTDSSIFDKFSSNYDPFALPLAVVYVVNNPLSQQPNIIDLRTRGGGVTRGILQQEMIELDDNIDSYWDVYSPSREAYPKGGYAIIQIPEEVRNNFQSVDEIYSIVRGNLTAGVAFELQDMDGNEWGQE
jgi:hypothetical protein